MSYFVNMSPAEVMFIRVYVYALRRHYAALRTVVDVMNPDGLGVKDFHTATRLATNLAEMHGDFEASLLSLRKKHKFKSRQTVTGPTQDELADLFELSFFKLVTAQKAEKNNKTIVESHDGWFSGKPEEWKNTIKTCKNLPPAEEDLIPDLLSECFNAMAKFFHLHSKFHKKFPPNSTKKIWPDITDELDDGDDDEVASPENPFDWLFDNDDDED